MPVRARRRASSAVGGSAVSSRMTMRRALTATLVWKESWPSSAGRTRCSRKSATAPRSSGAVGRSSSMGCVLDGEQEVEFGLGDPAADGGAFDGRRVGGALELADDAPAQGGEDLPEPQPGRVDRTVG